MLVAIPFSEPVNYGEVRWKVLAKLTFYHYSSLERVQVPNPSTSYHLPAPKASSQMKSEFTCASN